MSELKKYYKAPEFIEAGLDEAGRGPLIGRVYAAAVIINPNAELHPLLNDSKKMTRKRRGIVREWIEENCVFEVAYSDEKEIDELNILHATQKAMHKAIDNLALEPEYLIVDGNFFRKYVNKNGDHVNHVTIEKGDSNEWGFTLTRRVSDDEREGQYRSSVVMYLAPGGEIPRLKSKKIRVLPGFI